MSKVEAPIMLDKRGRAAWLTINRPKAMNAMDFHAHLALSEALDIVASDDEIRVLVLTGAGDRAFSAGRDLKELAATKTMTAAEKAALDGRWQKIRRLTDRHDFVKPIIARVNGLALGGGFELALACDIIIASDDAKFALPEAKRGLIPFAGGVHRLPRQIPLKIAMGYLLTGRSMSAGEAHQLGIVNEIAPRDKLDDVVESWIADILASAPLSIQSIKQSVMNGLGKSLEAAMAVTCPLEEIRKASLDSVEGPLAFAEGRAPQWAGK